MAAVHIEDESLGGSANNMYAKVGVVSNEAKTVVGDTIAGEAISVVATAVEVALSVAAAA